MLFHVTLVHDGAHCPGYPRELTSPTLEAFEKRDELAQSFGVKLHMVLNAAPDHVFYIIGEEERLMQMAMFVGQLLPIEQAEIRMQAVERFEDSIAFVQAMMPPPGA